MKHALAGIGTLVLVASCGGLIGSSSDPPGRVAVSQDGAVSCGGSGKVCCDGTACNNGLTCNGWTCTAVSSADVPSGSEAGEPGSPMGPQGCCGPGDAGTVASRGSVVADSVFGFSATQGQCGWSYGYLPAGAEPFTAVTIFNTSQFSSASSSASPWWGSVWEESTAHPPWIVTFASAQHPNATPVQWNDRRWTSTVLGTVSIEGHVAKLDPTGGDGITAHIRVAGVEIWNAMIAYNDTIGVNFNLSADVQLGTTIDFLIDPNTNDLYDTTTLTAVVSK